MTPPDPLDLLHELRPSAATLERVWPAGDRAELRRRVLADTPDAPPARFTARRLLTAGALAAGVAAATVLGVVLPGNSPGGPESAAAAELHRLALVAGRGGDTVGPDQFLFSATVEEETVPHPDHPPVPGETRIGDVDRRPERETYLSPSGISYTRIGPATCLIRQSYAEADAAAEDGLYANLTAVQLAALPTEPGRLAAFFDAHPAGDNRGTRNRFMDVGDLLRSGLASPQLRAAALEVLADTAGLGVRRHVTDNRGRPATAVDQRYADGVETLFFDPATSVLLEERQADDDGTFHYSGMLLTSRVVDRLPNLPRC